MAVTGSARVERALRLGGVGILLLTCIAIIASGRTANAASFDCKKATETVSG